MLLIKMIMSLLMMRYKIIVDKNSMLLFVWILP